MEKKKKSKFRVNRLCSSDNYELSKELHRQYLKEEHEKNIVFIQEITRTTIVKKHAYVRCWGKEFEVTEERAEILKESCTIIWR